MKVRNIIKQRSIWMAVGIILVILRHIKISFGSYLLFFAGRLGYLGVDIFMFASGIGIYYSLNKSTVLQFYKKRISRIAVPYLVFMLFWIPLFNKTKDLTIIDIILNLLGVEYFFYPSKALNWYIGAIVLIYSIAPLLKKITDSKINPIIVLLLSFALSFLFTNNQDLIIISSRLPILILGIYVGKMGVDDRSIKKSSALLTLMLMVVFTIVCAYFYLTIDGSILWNYGLYWYPAFFIVPGLCIVISFLANWMDGTKAFFMLNKLGGMTFEILMIHLSLVSLFSRIQGQISSVAIRDLSIIALMFISVPLAQLLKAIADKIRMIIFS